MKFVDQYLNEVALLATAMPRDKIAALVFALSHARAIGGRVFVIGMGGSAANASHMVNDLRKLCDVEAYAPSDNVAELTARANDDGLDSIYTGWLKVSRVHEGDLLIVLSVGGGDHSDTVSRSLTNAVRWAWANKIAVWGIVGKATGWLAQYNGDNTIVVPVEEKYPDRVTPHAEEFQAVVWHCIVSHPDLARHPTTW